MEPRDTIITTQTELEEEFKEVMDKFHKDTQECLNELQELQLPPNPYLEE